MSVIAAPLDELNEFVDKIQSWLNVNRLVDEALTRSMQPLFELTGWTGTFADIFQDKVKEEIMDELKPILSVIDAFLSALNEVINAIQTILSVLYKLSPMGVIDSVVGFADEVY